MPASGNKFNRPGKAESAQNNKAYTWASQWHKTKGVEGWMGPYLRKTREQCPWFRSPYSEPVTVTFMEGDEDA